MAKEAQNSLSALGINFFNINGETHKLSLNSDSPYTGTLDSSI